MMTKESLVTWASLWVPNDNGQRERFVKALKDELSNWTPPAPLVVFCKNCPFSEHMHYEVDGKLTAPGCSGFEQQV